MSRQLSALELDDFDEEVSAKPSRLVEVLEADLHGRREPLRSDDVVEVSGLQHLSEA